MNHDYLMQFSDPSPRLYSHLHLHAISLCSTLLSSFHFSLHSPTHSAQLLTPLLTLHSTAAQTYLTETVRQLKTRTCSPPRQTKPCSSSPGTPAASLILHCTALFIFLRPSFFFFFLFPILFVPFIPFPLFTSLHVTALLLPRNGALFAIDVLYFNSPHPLSFLLLTSPYLTSSRLVSSHLPSLSFTSPLSLSPPHHLISSITPFRFGIEGTILLEPLAAKINSRPESPEGSISSSVKFNSATHTVTIHKVRSSDCCYLCLYSLY